MKKLSLFLLMALAFGLFANLTIAHASPSPDPEVQRVGFVVAYTPNDSITIVDKDGAQFTFTIAPSLKIVPAHRMDLLKVGAYVTIIAPNNVPGGKHIATGIVIHPQAPSSFPIPTFTFTPLPTDTTVPTEAPTEASTETPAVTETPTSTEMVTETPTELVTATETVTQTTTPTASETPTETATATPTETPTETPAVTTLSQTTSQSSVQSFIDWLSSLLRQFAASGK